MESLGEYLGGVLKEQKAKNETQGLNPGIISSYFVFGNYRFKIRITKILVEQQNIGGESLIWGNSTFGTWGSFKWSLGTTVAGIYGNTNSVYGSAQYNIGTGFVLGNSTFGVLGTSLLGGTMTDYVQVEEIILNQTIPTIARKIVADWLAGSSRNNPEYIGLGTDGTEYSESDTSLGNEIGRKTITYNISDSKRVEFQIEVLSTDTEYHSDTFKEVGLMATGGDLFGRGIISDLTMDPATNTRITIRFDLDDDSIGDATMCTSGINEVKNWLGNSSATAPTQMAWGTGSDSISSLDTSLSNVTERNILLNQTTSDDTAVLVGIMAKDEATGEDITRSGLYNGSTGSDLFCETKFGTISKSSLFQIYETDKIKII